MKTLWLSRAAILLLAGALCACSQQAKKDRYVRRGDKYYATGQYDAAEIEYLNAGRIDSHDAHAIARLGQIYFADGRLGKAYEFLTGAIQLDPDNVDVRMDRGLYLLALGKKADAAKDALFVLSRNPGHPDAPLLLAETVETRRQIAQARDRLKTLPPGAPVLVAQATLDLKESRIRAATSLLEEALQKDPGCANAATALGTISWEQHDLRKAGTYFAKAADLSPMRSGKRMQYVQFMYRTGDAAGARALLKEVLSHAPDYLPAGMLLAEIEENEHHYVEAAAAARNVVARDPSYPDALLLTGRLALARNDPQSAITSFEYGLTFYPHNPILQYELAQAYLATGASEKAEAALNLAVAWAPDFVEAATALAQIDDRKGDYPSEIVLLKETAQRRPDAGSVWLLLAEAYVRMEEYDDALAIYRNLAAANPHSPRPLTLEGVVLVHDGRLDEAEAAYFSALRIDPNDIPALQQLVELYIAERKYTDARALLAARLGQSRDSAPVHVLLARVDLAQHRFPEGESELQRAIAIQPNLPDAYFLLAEVYYTTHQDQQALADLKKTVTEDPRRTSALMLMGSIEMTQKNWASARDSYEKVLAIDPNFSPALNNLAYLYSEQFHNLDRAFELAQRTRKLMPDEPHAEDTLGWVLYRKKQYAWASSLLHDASANLPGDAEALYHLGMTEYMMGQEDRARQDLGQSVRGGDFPGIAEARHCLAVLNVNVATAGAAEQSLLERDHDDPVALARLAAIYERKGAVDQAIATCNAALAIDPHDVPALTRLARLYESKGNLDKAYDAAKSAHGYAPGDADASLALGRLAFRLGNYSWSDSVLSDAADLRPTDPEIRYHLALAEYSLGRVDQAVQDMQRVQDAPNGSHHSAAARFLRLAPAGVAASGPSPRAIEEAQADLAKDPADVPSLMIDADAHQAKGDWAAAIQRWSAVLAHYPQFAPAARDLVVAYALHPGDPAKMTQAAVLARDAYLSDPEVAKACGIIAFHQGDFSRADELFEECAAARNTDAEVYYYLGMSELQLKKSGAQDSLKRSLQLHLAPNLAADARKALAEAKP